MTALSVRVSEDPARPLGHAIVTLGGLPRTLETFEFALSRHGFGTNHLGSEGWQGAECWLQPEEAWFSGELLKFVIHPDLVFQLENMPYQLMVRGQGLPGTAAATFVWPLQLELEEGSASGERKVVGGTRINPAPAPRPEPAIQPPPLPQIGTADLKIPDMPIPDIGGQAPEGDSDQTRGLPPLSQQHHRPEPSGSVAGLEAVPPPLNPLPGTEQRSSSEVPAADVPVTAAAETDQVDADPGLTERPARTAPHPPDLASEPAMPVAPDPMPIERPEVPQRGRSGLVMGLVGAILLALVAAGWWWFSGRADRQQAAANSEKPPVVEAPAIPTRPHLTPEVPVPVAKPTVRPDPPPEPAPIPTPAPTPQPAPARQLAPPARPVPEPPVSVPPSVPVQPERSTPSTPARPTRPGAGPSLEDELKSQFDPTQQELEKRLRSQRSP
jgi:hypothetical protein